MHDIGHDMRRERPCVCVCVCVCACRGERGAVYSPQIYTNANAINNLETVTLRAFFTC